MNIRHCVTQDAAAICSIYNHYVASSVITFEESEVSKAEMIARIEKGYPWLVLENAQGEILGYAYGAPWAIRSAFRHTLEITVYLHHEQGGHGYASALYEHLMPLLKARECHVIVAAISLPNPQSIHLHEKFAFEQVAHFKQVGYKFDRWIDVGHWQLTL